MNFDESIMPLVRLVASSTATPVEVICSPIRRRSAARARFVVYTAMQILGKSLPDIGRACGGRDHSTIHHGINAVTEPERALAKRIATAMDNELRRDEIALANQVKFDANVARWREMCAADIAKQQHWCAT